MNEHEKINYVEFSSKNMQKSKEFFCHVFSWEFQDFGPDYTAFSNQGIDGGFFQSNQSSSAITGAALLVFYSNNIESTQEKIEKAGGTIIKSVFSFPGGRRFHFTEPGGNEFAVWTDKGA